MPQTVQIPITVTITDRPPVPPLVAPKAATLPDMKVGEPVTVPHIVQIKGGLPPYQPPVLAGTSPKAIPAGLSLSIDDQGMVSVTGTPTVPGKVTFVIDVSDSSQ
jgi:hypothetical protein